MDLVVNVLILRNDPGRKIFAFDSFRVCSDQMSFFFHPNCFTWIHQFRVSFHLFYIFFVVLSFDAYLLLPRFFAYFFWIFCPSRIFPRVIIFSYFFFFARIIIFLFVLARIIIYSYFLRVVSSFLIFCAYYHLFLIFCAKYHLFLFSARVIKYCTYFLHLVLVFITYRVTKSKVIHTGLKLCVKKIMTHLDKYFDF